MSRARYQYPTAPIPGYSDWDGSPLPGWELTPDGSMRVPPPRNGASSLGEIARRLSLAMADGHQYEEAAVPL